MSAGASEEGKEPFGPLEPNTFSLQLNSNYFPTPVCAGRPAGCVGWQQFLNTDSPVENSVFMQYWLLHWDTTLGQSTCPKAGSNSGRGSGASA